MTPELFSDAMNEIGAKYVEEALTYKRPAQRSFWSKLAKRAAMVALVALLALSGFAVASPAARAAMIHWVERGRARRSPMNTRATPPPASCRSTRSPPCRTVTRWTKI